MPLIQYGYTSSRFTEIDAPISVLVNYANIEAQLYAYVSLKPYQYDNTVNPASLDFFRAVYNNDTIIVPPNGYLTFASEIVNLSPFITTETVTLYNDTVGGATVITSFDIQITNVLSNTLAIPATPWGSPYISFAIRELTTKSVLMAGITVPIVLEVFRTVPIPTIQMFVSVNTVPAWGGTILEVPSDYTPIYITVQENDFVTFKFINNFVAYGTPQPNAEIDISVFNTFDSSLLDLFSIAFS